MFENTPSDRVQLVGLGELLSPATCMICGNGTCDEGYVRLGVFYDFEGEQYLCRTCVIQVAELFGCLTPEEAQHLQHQAELLAAENATINTNLGDAHERLRVFYDALAGISPDLSGVLSSNSSDSGAEGVGLTVTVDADDSGRADEAESKPAESVTESDSSGISESTASNRSKVRINL